MKLTEYGYYTIAGHIVCAGCYKHPNAAWKVIEARLELERIKKNSKGSEKVLRGLGP